MQMFTGGVLKEIVIKNQQLEVKLLSTGAAIYSIKYDGKDMVLSPDDKSIYANNTSYQGAIVGPTAGRVRNAQFELDGNFYDLPKNFLNKHNLHGSDLQNVEYDVKREGNKVEFSKVVHDPYYQANLDIKIIYQVIDSSLDMEINVKTDNNTIVNMTNHSYFNLGFENLILDHELTIPSSHVWYLDDESLPQEKVEIEKSVLDFTKGEKIGNKKIKHEQFDKVVFIDHPFKLSDNTISLYNPVNDIRMDVETNQPYVVIYSGNYLADEGLSRNGKSLKQFETICIETQAMPDAIHSDDERETVILRIDQEYQNKTTYKFSKENDNE